MAYTSKTNWTDGEVLKAEDLNRVEQGVDDIYTRLDTSKNASVTLEPGTNMVTSSKDSLFNLNGITGRTLLNLLGRDGNFESLSGWTFVGGSGALDPSNNVYGSSGVKMTLSANTGTISKSIPVTLGKKYLLAADLKNGTVSNAKVYATGVNGTLVTSTSSFQTSYMLFAASSTTNLTMGISVSGASGQVVYADALRLYELSDVDYNTASKMNITGIVARYPYTDGISGVLNPYVIRWTSPEKTKIATMLAFQTELLADPVTGLKADIIAPTLDGQYTKTAYWKRTELNTTLPWTFNNNGASGSGLKRIGAIVVNLWTPFSIGGIYATKYNGKLLIPQTSNSTTPTVKDGITLWDNGSIYLDIANSDSGWGENYTPNSSEIKAFMLGWRMYTQGQDAYVNTYVGSGTKNWVKIGYDSTGNIPSDAYRTSLPTVESGYVGSFSTYQLIYTLAVPQTETITAEGILSLAEGDNIIEVGAGIILRERVFPAPDLSVNYSWNINNSNFTSSLTTKKIDKFINIFKNSKLDFWNTYGNTATPAGALAQISPINYDTTATYTVSYIPLDRYPNVSFSGSYTTNEKSLFKELLNNAQTNTSRVSVLENSKAEKEKKLTWINPTMLNGWVNIPNRPSLAYAVDGNNVYIRGEIKAGVIGSPLFLLPIGARPRSTTEWVVYSYSQSGIVNASFVVLAEGVVQVQNGSNEQISIGYIQFSTY